MCNCIYPFTRKFSSMLLYYKNSRVWREREQRLFFQNYFLNDFFLKMIFVYKKFILDFDPLLKIFPLPPTFLIFFISISNNNVENIMLKKLTVFMESGLNYKRVLNQGNQHERLLFVYVLQFMPSSRLKFFFIFLDKAFPETTTDFSDRGVFEHTLFLICFYPLR